MRLLAKVMETYYYNVIISQLGDIRYLHPRSARPLQSAFNVTDNFISFSGYYCGCPSINDVRVIYNLKYIMNIISEAISIVTIWDDLQQRFSSDSGQHVNYYFLTTKLFSFTHR